MRYAIFIFLNIFNHAENERSNSLLHNFNLHDQKCLGFSDKNKTEYYVQINVRKLKYREFPVAVCKHFGRPEQSKKLVFTLFLSVFEFTKEFLKNSANSTEDFKCLQRILRRVAYVSHSLSSIL